MDYQIFARILLAILWPIASSFAAHDYFLGVGFLHNNMKFSDENDPRSYDAAKFYGNGGFISFEYKRAKTIYMNIDYQYSKGMHEYSKTTNFKSTIINKFIALGYHFPLNDIFLLTPFLGMNENSFYYQRSVYNDIYAKTTFFLHSYQFGIKTDYLHNEKFKLGINWGLHFNYFFRKKFESATASSLNYDENYNVKTIPRFFYGILGNYIPDLRPLFPHYKIAMSLF